MGLLFEKTSSFQWGAAQSSPRMDVQSVCRAAREKWCRWAVAGEMKQEDKSAHEMAIKLNEVRVEKTRDERRETR